MDDDLIFYDEDEIYDEPEFDEDIIVSEPKKKKLVKVVLGFLLGLGIFAIVCAGIYGLFLLPRYGGTAIPEKVGEYYNPVITVQDVLPDFSPPVTPVQPTEVITSTGGVYQGEDITGSDEVYPAEDLDLSLKEIPESITTTVEITSSETTTPTTSETTDVTSSEVSTAEVSTDTTSTSETIPSEVEGPVINSPETSETITTTSDTDGSSTYVEPQVSNSEDSQPQSNISNPDPAEATTVDAIVDPETSTTNVDSTETMVAPTAGETSVSNEIPPETNQPTSPEGTVVESQSVVTESQVTEPAQVDENSSSTEEVSPSQPVDAVIVDTELIDEEVTSEVESPNGVEPSGTPSTSDSSVGGTTPPVQDPSPGSSVENTAPVEDTSSAETVTQEGRKVSEEGSVSGSQSVDPTTNPIDSEESVSEVIEAPVDNVDSSGVDQATESNVPVTSPDEISGSVAESQMEGSTTEQITDVSNPASETGDSSNQASNSVTTSSEQQDQNSSEVIRDQVTVPEQNNDSETSIMEVDEVKTSNSIDQLRNGSQGESQTDPIPIPNRLPETGFGQVTQIFPMMVLAGILLILIFSVRWVRLHW